MTTTVPPAEVQARAVADWVTKDALDRNPYSIWKRLRQESPVAWVPLINSWVITKRADMEELYGRIDLVTAEDPDNPINPALGAPNILMVEGSTHRDIRGSINEVLLPRTVDTYVDSMLAPIVRQRLDLLPPSGRIDLHHDYLEPVSVLSLGALIGLGHVPLETLQRWFHELAAGAFNLEGDPQQAAICAAARAEVESHLAEVFRRLEREPDGSLISDMLHNGMPPGETRPWEYIMPSLHVILVGGAQEPGHTAGMVMHGLFANPEQLREVQADIDGLLPRAINEGLRWQPPLGTIERMAARDFVWRGQQIREGEMIVFLTGSVNRDEDFYENPDAFDIHRSETTHRAFGMGRHMCMGHWFARRQMQMMLASLLKAYPELTEVPGDPGELTGWAARGPKRLPVELGQRVAEYTVDPVAVSTSHSHAPRTLTVRVESVDRLAEDVVSLTFAPVADIDLPAWTPGTHIDVHVVDGIIRQYSLCGDPADRRRYRIAVHRDPASRGGSTHIHDRIEAGSLLEIGEPRNRFELELSDAKVRFIAGGIGITPLLPMVRQAEAAGADWDMLYLGRSRANLAFVPELAQYGDRVRVWESNHQGLLDLYGALADLSSDARIYCCGPEPLLEAVRQAAPAGVEVRSELFVRSSNSFAPEVEFELEIEGTGLVTTVPPGKSVLNAMEELGVYVSSGCTVGVCGSCVTEVVSGDIDHRDAVLTEAEKTVGDRMALCVSRCTSPRMVVRPPQR